MQAEAQAVPRSTQARLDRGVAFDIFRGLIEQKKAAENRVAEIRQKLAVPSSPFFGLTHAADFNPPITQIDRWGLANAQKIIQRSREALERIRAGTYGICFTCRQPIDPRRLRAVPHTRFCVNCKNSGTNE